ncbi:MAG: IS1634 family transposase [Thermodesulfobacteriota bacterium]
MAHLYKKVKKGREYFYIRETQRVYGKPTTVNQVYLGTAEKVQAILEGQDEKAREGFSPKEFGSVFVLNEIDRNLDLAGLVDELLPPKKRTKGPSLGDLFFYAALNRAIDSTSKRKLAAWYETTDILRIRPVRLESLSSQNFWNHWNRISEADLEEIIHRFFQRVHAQLPVQKENFLLEITSYSSTSTAPDDAPLSGKRKGAKAPHQFWLALITERATGVPIYYQIITKAIQESKSLETVLKNMLAKIADMGIEVKDLTVILGKGTESPALIDLIDSQEDLHLIAAYSTDFIPELATVPLEDFSPLPCKYNRRLLAEGTPEDQILYYETQASVWGRPHKVAITYNPRYFASDYEKFKEKIQKVQQEFINLERKWGQGELPDEDPQSLEAYLLEICQYLQLRPDLFKLSFANAGETPALSLELQEQVMEEVMRGLGKTILVTDHKDWSGEEISEANIDRCIVEEQIRQTGITLQEVLLPQYHWTESKLRVNIFVCMVALSYLILLHMRLQRAGLLANPKEVMAELRNLKTAVFWHPEEKKLKRRLAPLNDLQLAILQALGFQVEEGKVLSAK